MRKLLVSIITLISLQSLAQSEAGNTPPNLRLSGDVSLLSHYIEHGLSQSNYSPALQGSFWFNFGPQFRLGVWGSNTNYKNSDDNFNLRFGADINVNLSAISYLTLGYFKSNYYNGGDRTGELFELNIFVKDVRVLYEKTTNWEGSGKRGDRFGFGATSNVLNTWKWNNEIGYTTIDSDNLNNYFDFKSGLGTRWGALFFEGALTGTSESSQFDGRGDFFFILSASTDL